MPQTAKWVESCQELEKTWSTGASSGFQAGWSWTLITEFSVSSWGHCHIGEVHFFSWSKPCSNIAKLLVREECSIHNPTTWNKLKLENLLKVLTHGHHHHLPGQTVKFPMLSAFGSYFCLHPHRLIWLLASHISPPHVSLHSLRKKQKYLNPILWSSN